MPVLGLLAMLAAGCSSGQPPVSHPAAATSAPPARASSPTAAAVTAVTWPTSIGTYILTNTGGKPVTAPAPDPGFISAFPQAKNAQDAVYLPKGAGRSDPGITVVAGQMRPGGNPAAAFGVYYRAGAVHGAATDEVTVPPGPRGGQAHCWLQLPAGSMPATAFCMWVDGATYGALGANPQSGADPTAGLAKTMLTLRASMEH